jgi:hypothetical protein
VESPDERKAISEVTDRLRKRFPDVPDGSVERVVDRSYHELDGAPIRGFVPILVEKQASDLLARAVA